MKRLSQLPARSKGRVRTGFAGLSFLVFAACGGGEGGGGSTPTDPGGGSGGGDPTPRVVLASPSFGEHIQEIFERKGCTATGCHGAVQAAGLDLRASASHRELVGVQATNEPLPRVAPGDPVRSYLMAKVEGRHTVGSLMPIGRTPLDSIDLTNLRNWIQNGAPNN